MLDTVGLGAYKQKLEQIAAFKDWLQTQDWDDKKKKIVVIPITKKKVKIQRREKLTMTSNLGGEKLDEI